MFLPIMKFIFKNYGVGLLNPLKTPIYAEYLVDDFKEIRSKE